MHCKRLHNAGSVRSSMITVPLFTSPHRAHMHSSQEPALPTKPHVTQGSPHPHKDTLHLSAICQDCTAQKNITTAFPVSS